MNNLLKWILLNMEYKLKKKKGNKNNNNNNSYQLKIYL